MVAPEFRIVMRIRVIQLLLLTLLLLLATIIVTCGGDDEEKKDDAIVIGGESCPPPDDFMPSEPDDGDTGSQCNWDWCRAYYHSDYDPRPYPLCDHYVVIDGKMWTVCSTDFDMSYDCSVCEAEYSDFCGRSDWRLPTIEELRLLYDPSNPTQLRWCEDAISTKVFIKEPFCLMARAVWSSSYEGYYAFNYWDGTEEQWGLGDQTATALFVRP
jgi:hypothetical protein